MYQRIRNLREDLDYTQTYLAHILHIGQSTYSYYETGRGCMPIETLKTLALFFNTSTDYLLELTDTPTPYPRKK